MADIPQDRLPDSASGEAPADRLSQSSMGPTTPKRRARSPWLIRAWAGWLALSVIQNGLWLASRLSGDGDQSYWPIWVMLPLGALLLAYTIWEIAGGKSSEGSCGPA